MLIDSTIIKIWKDVLKIINYEQKIQKMCKFTMNPDFKRMYAWQWGQGIAIYSLEKAYYKTKNKEYIDFIDDWITKRLECGTPGFSVNTTAPLHGVIALYEINKDTRFLHLCEEFAEYLVTKNPRCEKGGFEHTCTENKMDNEMWIDTVMVAGVFLVRYGLLTGKRMYVDEALRQMIIHYDFLSSSEGLLFHGYSSNDRKQKGVIWGRGNSWFDAACGIVLSMIDDTYELKEELQKRYIRHLKAIVKYQRENGAWGTVINNNSSYSETSGTAGIALGLRKALELGIVEKEFETNRDRAYEYLLGCIGEDGGVTGGSAGTCVMPSDEDYKNIALKFSEFTQGLAILAFSA